MIDNYPDPEWSLLLAACSAAPCEEKRAQILSLLGQPVNWPKLFALADHHRTLPVLGRSLMLVEGCVPPDQIQELKQSQQNNLLKSLLLSRELIRIIGRLTALGIEVLPYKGPVLAEVLYGDVAMRQAGDIDVFIRARDLARIRDAARELGYTPHQQLSASEERAYLKSGYELAFDGVAGPNLLEVQWAIQPRFYAVDFDIEGLFQRAMTVNVSGQPMRTPSASDLFLVLSLHAAKHVYGRLGWLCDIAQLMGQPGIAWEWIGAQARALGIVRILRVTMLAANHMLGAAIPAAANEALPEDHGAPALAEEIRAHIFSRSGFNVESASYFRLMMRLRERPADRLRLLTRLAFTPGPSEWSAVRLPQPLFPLYSVVRFSRLAARLIRV